jgi:MFS family permease
LGPSTLSLGLNFKLLAQVLFTFLMVGKLPRSRLISRQAKERTMANPTGRPLSGYRWVIEALIVVMLIVQVMAWLAPAPLIAPIRTSLHIGMAEFGLIISVIALCIAVFSFLGGVLTERLGTLRTLLAGIWLLALGEIASGFSPGYGVLLLCRVVEGVGYGFMIGPPAALVMDWFGEREWPYVATVNAIMAYVGLAVLFSITPSVYYALGSLWRSTLTG